MLRDPEELKYPAGPEELKYRHSTEKLSEELKYPGRGKAIPP